MNRSDAPKKQPVAFGVNGQRENLPDTTPAGDNTASYDAGFPAVTMILKSAGGLPPKGEDINQILYELSNLGRWSSSGSLNTFDTAFSTAIGGYPSGSMLLSDDGLTIYISTTDANTNNPNSISTGWKSLISFLGLVDSTGTVGRLINTQTITSSGTYTPTTGTKRIKVTLTGGGGGGGNAQATSLSQTAFGAGGGAGATTIAVFNVSDIVNFTVTIGAGGTAQISGGSSTFNGLTAGNGGGGSGNATPANAAGGAGGTASGGQTNIGGGFGSDGQQGNYYSFGNGGASYWGGGGRAGSGGGTKATAYGSGGGGAYDTALSGSTKAGGAGMSGVCVIEEYA